MSTTPSRSARLRSQEPGSEQSPYGRVNPNSPSHQLLLELSMLQVQEQRNFQEKLDQDVERRADVHLAALAAAAAEHDRIRDVAEAVRKQEELKIQIERQEEQARQQREVVELQRQQAQHARAAEEEAEKQKLEDDRVRREADERKVRLAAEAKRRAEEAAEEARREEEAAAANAQRQRDIEKRARDALEKAAADQAAAPKPDTTPKPDAAPGPGVPPGPVPRSPPPSEQPANNLLVWTGDIAMGSKEAIHKRYLEIHQNLKTFRKNLIRDSKSSPVFSQPQDIGEGKTMTLKAAVGDTRRVLRVRMSQLKVSTKENTQQSKDILDLFRSVTQVKEPKIDMTQFLLSPPPSSPETQVPVILIYFVSLFSKAILNLAKGGGGGMPEMFNTLGVFGVSMFGKREWLWNGKTLMDILLAKLHRDGPPLFGICGSEDTEQGRRRIGWKAAKDSEGVEVGWKPLLDYHRQLQGVAGLFAGLTLRQYHRSNLTNPLPQWHFWHSMATITNLPRAEITEAHILIVQALLDNNFARIMDIFGAPGMLMIRHALMDFPARAKPAPAMKAMMMWKATLPEKLMLPLE